MKHFNNQLVNIPFEYIKGFDNCYFLEDGRIYNIDTKKFSKKIVKSCSVGYNINGSFVLDKNIERIKVGKLSNNNFKETELSKVLNTF
jgi:hypothetical protein